MVTVLCYLDDGGRAGCVRNNFIVGCFMSETGTTLLRRNEEKEEKKGIEKTGLSVDF